MTRLPCHLNSFYFFHFHLSQKGFIIDKIIHLEKFVFFTIAFSLSVLKEQLCDRSYKGFGINETWIQILVSLTLCNLGRIMYLLWAPVAFSVKMMMFLPARRRLYATVLQKCLSTEVFKNVSFHFFSPLLTIVF